MNTDFTVEQIRIAVEELRNAEPGPAARKQLDSLFRTVHNLKAAAAADGLTELSHAAHELENFLQALRTGKSTLDGNVLQQVTEASAALSEDVHIPNEIWSSLKAEEKNTAKQSIKEGATLLLVQASFDVADFDQQFQNLKETLSSSGEVISMVPSVESEEKINFRVLYASTAGAGEILDDLAKFPGVTVEELVRQTTVELLQQAIRAGQAAALELGKEVDFEVRGEDLSLDDSLRDALVAPLLHLVRNAVDHGIEASDERSRMGKQLRGRIVIETTSVGDHATISVTDDGRGLNPDLIKQIFQPGFSTATEITEISGRGVGLDVVATTLKELGGSIDVNSEPGKGSTFRITLKNPS